MLSKIQIMAQLAEQTRAELTTSHQKWISFLQTMSRVYKYPFDEQLMIYAQRPEATACAGYDIWNNHMGRFVKRGSTGIALIDSSGDYPKLHYVFDVADTGGNEKSRRLNLWEFHQEHNDAVRDALMKRFEIGGISLADQLEETARWIVDDFWYDHREDILHIVDGSYVGDYHDEETIRSTFCEAATVSTGYALLHRCGLDPEERYEPADFMQVFDFNTPKTASMLGCCVSFSAEKILRQIEVAIRKYEREKQSERSQNHERTDLHPKRRLPDSQPAAVRIESGAAAQVRQNAEDLSEGTPSPSVERAAADREVVAAPERDRPGSQRTAGTDDAPAHAGSRRHRAAEGGKSHEVGKENERAESTGRGSDPGRADLQLTDQQTSFFVTASKQPEYLTQAESVDDTPSAFSIPKNDIDRILQIGSNSENHRVQIVSEFSKEKSTASQAEYLKQLYHGGFGMEDQGSISCAWYADDGIHLTKSRSARHAKTVQILSWGDAARRIGTLLDQGQFATNVEIAEAPAQERAELANQLWYLTSDLSISGTERNLLPSIRSFHGGFPEETAQILAYLSDPDSLKQMQQEFQTFLQAHQDDPAVLRFHYHHPDLLMQQLSELDLPRKEYTSDLRDVPPTQSFITEDELDAAFTRGSGVSGGKGRIYTFFRDVHTQKEKAEFLKKEYGIGGSSHALSGATHSSEDHDSKGISFRKEGCPEVVLTWDKVAQRISDLIHSDRYLSRSEKKEFASIQDTHVAADGGQLEAHIASNADQASISPIEAVPSAQALSDREMDLAIQKWNGDMDSKRAVVRYLQEHEQEPDTADWLRQQFGSDVFSVEFSIVPWSDVQQRLEMLIREDRFFTDEEQDNWEHIDPVQIRERLDNGDSARFTEQVFSDVDRLAESDVIISTPDLDYAREHLIPGETEFTWDDRKFMVEQIDEFDSKVELRDITFSENTGFPIFRVEPISNVRAHLEAQLAEPVIPVSVSDAENFHITDFHLGEGGPKAKFMDNLRAIQLLKQLELENRQAQPDEQEILSRYIGWGGLADAFDPDKTAWKAEYDQLRETLTPSEYDSARGSTLNAHYTSPTVIQAIYDVVGNMGFETGNILEPACGVGNFLGMLPDSMQNSRLYGVELDSISGRIAQKLYPKANITVAGFETTDRRDFFDLAVGNVPFGSYQVNDRAYNKLNFSIHNYFFAKALDQVRPGGIVAFVTSRYTMDAKDSTVRRYLAQRADLLGAIRLPNDAFKRNAGAEVVSDILFLQKRDRPLDIVPEWTQTAPNENGHTINRYFLDHPDMVLGIPASESTAHGMDYTVTPREDAMLSELLHFAAMQIHGTYQDAELPDLDEGTVIDSSIPADPNVKNYSFTLVDDTVYYQENSRMSHPNLNATAEGRIKGMVALRDCVHTLMDLEMEPSTTDAEIQAQQEELNQLYDRFTAKYGLINDRANQRAFADDSSYYLLTALEVIDEDRKLERKADMFTKRTIKPHQAITSVDTASEALAVSISEKACVDMEYMSQLTGKTEEVLFAELRGVIFKDMNRTPDGAYTYRTADDFLSGNVREKLAYYTMALDYTEGTESYQAMKDNVDALLKAQPKDLDASEIEVRLGATWIDRRYVQQFMYETFNTPYYLRRGIEVNYAPFTAEWQITGKSRVSYNDVAAYTTYGTDRANAYKILEDSLNLRDVRIYDTIEEADGKERRVLNAKATTLAAQKQQAIRDAFQDWIWKDPQRRQDLVRQYNEEMNSCRPREYDGSHIVFGGINPEIELREHQKNAIAHVLYGGNTLLAHEVGAGKTFEMVAAAMEAKRLGLCTKSLFVVPNHLTEQWASEFLRLYPSANILVTTKKDFEPHNRKRFCARIATGDYEAIIIGHSQFEKIPISRERQERLLQEQIEEITAGIAEVQDSGGERFTIKQLERTKKGLEQRLEKLQSNERKDDVVTFEQLGVDRLFVDEAHSYKNLFLYTKMRNVAGLSTSDAQKSSDMFAKCRYMDELTGNRGVIFATGTPVSNSMTELYTMQRYLQYDRLKELNMTHFDCWASRFGETVTALELAPEGTGYRARTRFSKFFNLPELMNLFREVADIKTADQLHLPTPEVEYHNIVAKPTEHQQKMVQALSERAAEVHSGSVDPSEDNMLKITSDGRKLGLDQRIINDMLPDEPGTKVNQCVENIMKIWRDGQADKLTQLVFCDISTPKAAATGKKATKVLDNPTLHTLEGAVPLDAPEPAFTVYEDIRQKLIAQGVPPQEIAFIHEANTEVRKKELFGKVRSGQVRVLLGSTSKMGAGTNVQDRLVALHDLDCPWRPGDLAQRKGRIERQGNQNEKVHVFRYVTESTFDAYLWQTVENKQKFISQIMSSKSPVRSCEDVDETALSFAEIKALCAGDPRIKERMDLDVEVSRLKLMKADHQSKQFRLEDQLLKYFPEQIEKNQGFIKALNTDMSTLEAHPLSKEYFVGMEVYGHTYTDREKAGSALLTACKNVHGSDPLSIGSYRGFQMAVSFDPFDKLYVLHLKGEMTHKAYLGTDPRGNLTRIDNTLSAMPERLAAVTAQLDNLHQQQTAAMAESKKPFPQEAELQIKTTRLVELDSALNMDRRASSQETVEKQNKPSILNQLRNTLPKKAHPHKPNHYQKEER